MKPLAALVLPPRRGLAIVACAMMLSACGGPETMIASSILSAAIKTTIEQSIRNQPTPEELWHEVQFAQLERRALTGDTDAQFQLGQYYLQRQEATAQQWICAAANAGHPRAQVQYGHWFNEDRAREDLFPFIAITPNNATAYMWYDLAAANGEPRASHFRDNLIYAGMPVTQLEQGRARVASWTPQPCEGTLFRTASIQDVTR